jgi:hypothetical protein
VKEALQKGRKRFHIIAAGKTNIELAKSCAERISKEFSFVEKRKESYQGIYRGARMKLVCITIESPQQ